MVLYYKFDSYTTSLLDKLGDNIEFNKVLSFADETQLDEWFLGTDTYDRRLARFSDREDFDWGIYRRKLFTSYFKALDKVNKSKDSVDRKHSGESIRGKGPFEYLTDKVESERSNAFQKPLVESLYLSILKKGLLSLLNEMGLKVPEGGAAVIKGIEDDLKPKNRENPQDIERDKIEKLRTGLEDFKKNKDNDKEKISGEEIRIVNELLNIVNQYKYEKGYDLPANILLSKKINCLGASLLGASMLDAIGLRYRVVTSMEDHISLVLKTTDGKYYWLDFTPPNRALRINEDEVSFNVEGMGEVSGYSGDIEAYYGPKLLTDSRHEGLLGCMLNNIINRGLKEENLDLDYLEHIADLMISIFPQSPRGYIGKGHICNLRGDLQGQNNSLKKASELDKFSPNRMLYSLISTWLSEGFDIEVYLQKLSDILNLAPLNITVSGYLCFVMKYTYNIDTGFLEGDEKKSDYLTSIALLRAMQPKYAVCYLGKILEKEYNEENLSKIIELYCSFIYNDDTPLIYKYDEKKIFRFKALNTDSFPFIQLSDNKKLKSVYEYFFKYLKKINGNTYILDFFIVLSSFTLDKDLFGALLEDMLKYIDIELIDEFTKNKRVLLEEVYEKPDLCKEYLIAVYKVYLKSNNEIDGDDGVLNQVEALEYIARIKNTTREQLYCYRKAIILLKDLSCENEDKKNICKKRVDKIIREINGLPYEISSDDNEVFIGLTEQQQSKLIALFQDLRGLDFEYLFTGDFEAFSSENVRILTEIIGLVKSEAGKNHFQYQN